MRLRFILNTFVSGPQAWFFVADLRGYFRDEGLEVDFTPGDTLANAVPKLASGAFDVGYGDLNALVEHAAADPARAPVAVFVMHNRSPYTIAVPATGPVRVPSDLAGRTLVTHPNDAAWRCFAEFGRAGGIDVGTVRIETSTLPHRALIPLLLEGRWDGLFGFVNTLRAQALEAGIDPDATLRHLTWSAHVPALYGAALMVSAALHRAHPDVVTGLVRAVNRGLADTVADPDAAIDAVARRDPSIDRAANRERLIGTLGFEMAHPEGAVLGIGDLDDTRLAATIDLIDAVKPLPVRPPLHRLFDRQFLPPLAERVRTLARPA